MFMILTLLFTIVSVAMILIILAQRPSGGGLAGAFGGAGGGTDSVFGGRVGDALTWFTIVAFVLYLGLAVGLNLAPIGEAPPEADPINLTSDPAEMPEGTDTGAADDTGAAEEGTFDPTSDE